MSGLVAGVVFATLAALGNVIGGAFIFISRGWSRHSLKASLAFAGGFILAAALVGMVPESLEIMPKWGAPLILIGYLIVHFFEHVVGGHYHFAGDKHGLEPVLSTTVSSATMFAMFVHTFFDGVAIGSAFSVGESLGLIVFLAIILHKIPGGFAVSTVALASGASPLRAFGAAVLMGVGTVVGSVALFAVGPWTQYAVPISAGTLLHVGASDLIPEVNEGERWPITFTVIAGGLVFLAIRLLAGQHGH